MLDILAQQVKDVAPVGIGVGAGGLTLGSLALYLVKRKLTKVCDHVDNQKLHVSPDNGYVRQSMCDVKHNQLREDMQELKEAQHEGTKMMGETLALLRKIAEREK